MDNYKWIPIVVDTTMKELAIYHRWKNTIYISERFNKQSEEMQLANLEHEYFHSLYNKFTQEDIDFWNIICKKEELYISDYAKQMSKLAKWPNEEFAECWKYQLLADMKLKKLVFWDYRDIKLEVAYYLKKKYENKSI